MCNVIPRKPTKKNTKRYSQRAKRYYPIKAFFSINSKAARREKHENKKQDRTNRK